MGWLKCFDCTKGMGARTSKPKISTDSPNPIEYKYVLRFQLRAKKTKLIRNGQKRYHKASLSPVSSAGYLKIMPGDEQNIQC